MMVYCTGCRRRFQSSGYTLHVQRTKNARCKAAHEQHIKDIIKDEDSTMGSEDDPIDDPAQYDGDCFGQYVDGDVDWPIEDHTCMYFTLAKHHHSLQIYSR